MEATPINAVTVRYGNERTSSLSDRKQTSTEGPAATIALPGGARDQLPRSRKRRRVCGN
jgi:hypothetical protein